MTKRQVRLQLAAMVILSAVALLFQNCSRVNLSGGSHAPAANSSGNGDYYTGKPGYYVFKDPARRCSETSTAGNPFPNRQIFFDRGIFTLVRDNCQDMVPVVIPESELRIGANSVTYQNQVFPFQSDLSEYDLTPLVCPAGRSPIAGANPFNYLNDPLRLDTAEWNETDPHIDPVLDGSISALPRFRVEVTPAQPNRSESVGATQTPKNPIPLAGTQYAIQFLLQAGATNGAAITYGAGMTWHFFGVNLITGSVTALGGSTLPPLVTQPYGNGWLVTFFVTTAPDFVGGTVTAAPWSGQMLQNGDSIYATSAGWFPVDTYCSR